MKIIYEKNKKTFKNFNDYQGLFIVRNILYKVIIIMQPYNTVISHFYSSCSNVDSGNTIWNNKDHMCKTTDETTEKEAEDLLQKELKVYLDMFKKME